MNECCAAAAQPQDLLQILVFGLLMSAGHCLGMCGPLVCAASLPAQRGSEPSEVAGSLLAYHAGRIATYATIGLVLGSLGGLLPAEANAVAWQAALSLLAAFALVWVGLGLMGIFPVASAGCSGRLARGVAKVFGGFAGQSSGARKFGLGVANGLLPCGPVYTVGLAALASGGAWSGALAMAVFGVGTVPTLVALTCGWRWIGARLRVGFSRAGACLAVAMGVQLGLRGLAALEWIPHARIHEVVLW
ncbi:MAG: sulfite exporter TauE/SafE family protein [Planctomycetota bacterium]|nr:sulfite exporter TauE/SafE family protein [Planctomycetota bacterium]